ncbi:MAG TPA: adenylate/guanylate cyclase domain-containing protein [Acidimicrobiales bacterium]
MTNPIGVDDAPDERRHLTVMFSDLVGSTELSAAMDPEDLHEVIETYQRAVAAVVESHGGVVAQFQGDGVVAYFGYPVAIESAGRDAVSAGLAVVEAVSGLSENFPAELHVPDLHARVGVHTGEVVMAAVRAGGASRIADVFGEVPNLAARLQGAAAPGQVIVSDVTQRLVSGYFVMEPMGALTLKGIGREIPASLVLRHSSARRRLETGKLTGYVARRRESDWLNEHWASVQEGPARAVMVMGEPGIGKSRLLQEFTGSLSGSPVTTIYCGLRDALSPLRPFEALMGEVPVAPEVAANWVMEQASDRPLLLLVEDAHWADPSTIEVVGHVARSGHPVLEVLTARPEFIDDHPHVTPHRLDLGRLHPDDALAVVTGVPGGDQLSAEVQQALVDRADGIPLFLEELTRAVADGTADLEGGKGIPATLTEVITARLDQLGSVKRTAQLAAIIGRAFDRQTLQAVSGLDAPTLDVHIQHLIDQAVVEMPDDAGHMWFRHALIHEAAYRSVLRPERRRAHSMVADQMVSATMLDAHPESVAYHLGAAGRAPEAVDAWRQAARLARRHAHFREAAGHERELLELVRFLPEERQEVVEMEARSRLTLCLTAVDQSAPEAMKEGLRVQELARRTGDRKQLLRSLLVLLPWWQANADYPTIDTALLEAFELTAELADSGSDMILTQFSGAFRIWEGRVSEGVAVLEASNESVGFPLTMSLEHVPPQSLAVAEIVLAGTRIAAALGMCLLGRISEANWIRDDTQRFADARAIPQAQAVTGATAGIMAQLDDDPELVVRLTAQVGDFEDEVSTRQWRQWTAVLRWWAGEGDEEPEVPGPMLRPYFLMLLAQHESKSAEDALALLNEAMATAVETGEEFCLPEIMRVRGSVRRNHGDLQGGNEDARSAVATARRLGLAMQELRALTDMVAQPGASAGERVDLAALADRLAEYGSSRSLDRARAVLATTS